MSGRRKWIFHSAIMQNRTFFLLEPREAYDPFSASVHRCLLAREHLLDSRTPATFQGWSLGMGVSATFPTSDYGTPPISYFPGETFSEPAEGTWPA